MPDMPPPPDGLYDALTIEQRMQLNVERAADPSQPAAGARVQIVGGTWEGRTGQVIDADIDGRTLLVLIDDDHDMGHPEVGRHVPLRHVAPEGDDYGVQG